MDRENSKMVKNGQSGWSEPTSQKSLLGLLTHQKWLQTPENGTASLAKHDYNVSGVFGGVWMARGSKNMDFYHVTTLAPWDHMDLSRFHALPT